MTTLSVFEVVEDFFDVLEGFGSSLASSAVTFTNRHGFSSFSITRTSPAKATSGEVGYMNLQDAVDDVANGETINAITTGTAVVNRAVTFRVTGANVTITAAPGFKITKDPDGTYRVVAETPAKGSSSSDKSSKITTSNVVTCQMAGYPANYAWNEAAKACQPGYVNDNGVFVSTAGTGNRVKAVNTWDNGLGGSITGLIASTVAAVFAAYALRKWS